MATSGYTTVKVTNWNSLKFSWEILSQSIAQNTSTVSWKLELIATSDGYISSSVSKAGTVSIDSVTVSQFTAKIGINNNSTKTLASGTRTIAHNADGTKTSTYRFQMQFNITFDGVFIGTVSGGGSMDLKTIHRASQPSCITWPEHTQDVGEFGDTISIHMNRASSALTHTVRYEFGEQKGTIATNVGTGTTWTIPLSLMNLIPNSLSGSGTIYVDTYVEGELVGTKYCGFTATVPASVKPTCTLSLEDVAGIDDIYGSPVQGLSRIRATINPTLAYSSTIASYSITIDGTTSASSATTTAPLRIAGASPVTVKITDRRGRSASASYTMNVQAYNPPSLSKLAVHRCDADGTENAQGEYIKATFDAAVTSLNKKNTAIYTLKHKKTTASTYTEMELSALKNVYTVTGQTHIFAADGSSSYDVELEVADRHDAASRATSASTAFTLINWGADGRSMAIGKVAEKADTLQIGLNVEFIGEVTGSIFDAIGASSEFIINATAGDGELTNISATFEELHTAYNEGQNISLRVQSQSGTITILRCSSIDADNAFFDGVSTISGETVVHSAIIFSDNESNYTSAGVASIEYVISVFEELKTLIAEMNTTGEIAVLDKAILDLSKLA